MGTNYYAVKVKPSVYSDRIIHLGKSSAGWLYLFPFCEHFRTYPQFLKFLDDKIDSGEYVIFNEYDEEVSKGDLIELIQSKQRDSIDLKNPNNFSYPTLNIDGYRFTEGEFS